MNIFAYLVRPFIDRIRTYIDYNTLCYREYSNTLISGNDQLIEEIKNRVKAFSQDVDNSLKQFENEVQQFNQTKLKPTIVQFIKSEIDKRNLRSDSENKLNPFA